MRTASKPTEVCDVCHWKELAILYKALLEARRNKLGRRQAEIRKIISDVEEQLGVNL